MGLWGCGVVGLWGCERSEAKLNQMHPNTPDCILVTKSTPILSDVIVMMQQHQRNFPSCIFICVHVA